MANCRPDNWDKCREHYTFGIRSRAPHPIIERGDIFLMRVTGPGYGVRAIWAFEREQEVDSYSIVTWNDAKYSTLLFFCPLVSFHAPFNEEFGGKSRYSRRIRLNSGRIAASVVHLSAIEGKHYLKPLLRDKGRELDVSANYLGNIVLVADLLRDFVGLSKLDGR